MNSTAYLTAANTTFSLSRVMFLSNALLRITCQLDNLCHHLEYLYFRLLQNSERMTFIIWAGSALRSRKLTPCDMLLDYSMTVETQKRS
jgi:hypothetical protein